MIISSATITNYGNAWIYRDGAMTLKLIFVDCLRLWVMELMQLFLFWLIFRTLGTSAHNAAEFVMILADEIHRK